MFVVSVSAADIIKNFSDGALMYDLPEYIETGTTGYDKVVFGIDDKITGECDTEGKCILSDALPYGSHTFSAIGISSSGQADKDTHNIVYKKRKVITKHLFQDFDSFTGSNVSDMGFVFSSTRHDLNAVTGRSGSDGDKALEMVVNSDAKLVGGSFSLNSVDFIDYTGGISEVEFDMKYRNVSDNLSVVGMKLWTGNSMIIDGKKWKGTGVNVSTDWMHIKIISYADEEKISFYVDGVCLVDKADYSTNSTSLNNKSFGFCPWQGSARTSSNPTRAGIIIDNFSAINYKVYDIVDSVLFETGNESSSDAHSVSPSVTSIKLALSETLGNISTNTLCICTDEGRKIECDIAYNSAMKEITLSPKSIITSQTNMQIVFDKSVTHEDGGTLGKNFVIPFKTTNNKIHTEYLFKNGVNTLYTMKQVSSGTVSANISVSLKPGIESFNGVYVMTLQKDGKIVAMTAKNVSLNQNSQNTNFSLNLPASEGTELYLMLCDSFQSGIAQNKYIKIN